VPVERNGGQNETNKGKGSVKVGTHSTEIDMLVQLKVGRYKPLRTTGNDTPSSSLRQLTKVDIMIWGSLNSKMEIDLSQGLLFLNKDVVDCFIMGFLPYDITLMT